MMGEVPATELDLRAGGREVARVRTDDGDTAVAFEAVFHEVAADRRIVFSSTLTLSGQVATVSVSTVELHPANGGTRLVVVVQAAYIGQERPASRQQGTETQLDALGGELARSA